MRLTAKLAVASLIGMVTSWGTEAWGDTRLLGVTGIGSIVEIDTTTGAATLVGDSGFSAGAAASDSTNRMFTAGGSSEDANKLVLINPATGAGSVFLDLVGRPGGFGIRGIAFNSSDELYAVLSQGDTLAIDVLATIDTTTGDVALVGTDGETGLTNLQGLAFDNSDNLFGVTVAGDLVSIDATTAAATIIGGSGITPDGQALEFGDDGTLYAASVNLKTIDALGNATLIGSLGPLGEIRGLAFVPEPTTAAVLALGALLFISIRRDPNLR